MAGSLIMKAAEASRVAAGSALAGNESEGGTLARRSRLALPRADGPDVLHQEVGRDLGLEARLERLRRLLLLLPPAPVFTESAATFPSSSGLQDRDALV